MNLFEYLGLSKNHRPVNKVTQLVKHFDLVTEKNKEDKRYAIQIKEDGVCALTIVCDKGIKIYSRTGKEFTNTKYLIQTIAELNLVYGVYFGEMICSEVSLEVLSGAVSPNRKKELDVGDAGYVVPKNLHMRMFDFINLKAFSKGYSKENYLERYCKLASLITATSRKDIVSVIRLITIPNVDQIDGLLKELIDQGEEGLVIIDLNADWVAGHKGWRKMKKVRGCSYDLECIGYEEGKGKYKGKVANLIFKWKDNKTIKCMLGKGWSHQMAENMFSAIEYYQLGGFTTRMEELLARRDNPIGKIFAVYALEESSKGKLRLPKVGELRFDKCKTDV